LAWSKIWGQTERLPIEKVANLDGHVLTETLIDMLPINIIKAEDTMKFETLARKIGDIYTGVLKRQDYTPAAVEFFEEFRPLAGDPLVSHVLK
jgi:hypothetical protein